MHVSGDLLQVGARVAGHASLQDIRTFRIQADFAAFPTADVPLSWEIDENLSANVDDEPTFVIDGEYEVRIFQELDDDGGNRKNIAEVSLNVGALYELPDGETGAGTYEEAEVAAFTQTTARLAVYPYVRALVADMTVRLGLPGLLLPTIRVQIAAPAETSD